MDLARNIVRIGKHGSTYAVGSMTIQVLGLLLVPVFTHYLKPAQMGIVSLSTQLLAVIIVFVELGLLAGLTSHYFRVEAERRPRLVRTVTLGLLTQGAAACVVLSAAGIVLAPLILGKLPLTTAGTYGLWLLIVWGGLVMALTQLGIRVARLQERSLVSVSIELTGFGVQTAAGLTAVIALGWQGFGRQATLVTGLAAAAAVSLTFAWRKGRGGLLRALYTRALRTGATFIPHGLAGLLAITINAWLVNQLVDATALGIYGVAILFAQALQVTSQAVITASYPPMAGLMAAGDEPARRQQARLYALVFAGIALIALGIAVAAPFLVRWVIAPEYRPAGRLVPLLVLAWIFQCLYMISTLPLVYQGKGFRLAAATISSALAGIPLSLALIPWLGTYGAALSMLGCFLVRFLVVLVQSQRAYPIPWPVTSLLRTFCVVAALAAADVWVSPRLPLAAAAAVKAGLWLSAFPLLVAVRVVTPGEVAAGWRLCAEKVRSWRGGRR